MSLANTILSVASNDTLPSYLVQYEVGRTPLSTTPVVFAVLAAYLATIFSVQALMKDRPPFKLTPLFQLHNFLLTTGSGLLLGLIAEEVAPILWKEGLFGAMCHQSSWTPRLEFYYLINYYFKYIELIDTLFLALKKKPLAFLHVFHHSATALLCYTQLNGKPAVAWVPITLNLTVHVFMYYYYYATAGGAKIWWKKYLTSMQITQFVIDLFAVYFAAWNRSAALGQINLPHVGYCAASGPAAWSGVFLLTSYLGLFVDFYIRTYKTPSSKSGQKASANGVTAKKTQ